MHQRTPHRARVLTAASAVCVCLTFAPLRGQDQNFLMLRHVETLPKVPNFITTADMDGDGKTDLLAVGDDFMFLRGKGDGTFYPAVSTQPALGISSWAPTGDFDGDGHFDIIGKTSVYLGNGDGTFRIVANSAPLSSIVSSFVPINLGANQINAVVADFDEDGKSDIAGSDSTAYQVLLSDGGGSFRSSFSQVGQYTSAFAADMNRDGHADLILQTSPVNQPAVFQVFLGNGRGSFAAAQTVRFPITAIFTLLGDFNGDGTLDFRINSVAPAGSFVAFGNPDGSFRDPVNLTYFVFPIATGDYNADGLPDLLERAGSTLYISLSRGDGSFLPPIQTTPAGNAVQADWNGDGRPDLATNISGTLSILLNKALAPGEIVFSEVQSSADGSPRFAPGSLASLFGAGFSTRMESASVPPLTLGGIQLRVTDAAGVARLAELLYVASRQINFRIPPGTSVGPATIELLNAADPAAKFVALGPMTISASAPTMFTCGPGTNSLIATAETDYGYPEPTDVCSGTRFRFPAQVTFYGTGFVDATTENTRVFVADQRVSPEASPVKPLYVGPAGTVPGLDKVVIRLENNPTEDGDYYWSWISIKVNGTVVGEGYTPVY